MTGVPLEISGLKATANSNVIVPLEENAIKLDNANILVANCTLETPSFNDETKVVNNGKEISTNAALKAMLNTVNNEDQAVKHGRTSDSFESTTIQSDLSQVSTFDQLSVDSTETLESVTNNIKKEQLSNNAHDSENIIRRQLQHDYEIDNLSLLPSSNDNLIYEHLAKRFKKDYPYTHCGSILIALNPNRPIDTLYADQELSKHLIRKKTFSDLPTYPHIYTTIQKAYVDLVSNKRDQCILITGESGSGKTESAKLILKYICTNSSMSDNVQKLESLLVDTNLVLETMGNASTIHNRNSSRFGKFLDIEVCSEHIKLTNALLTVFLLEKTRVTSVPENEKNFHIFYQFLAFYNTNTDNSCDYLFSPKIQSLLQIDEIQDLSKYCFNSSYINNLPNISITERQAILSDFLNNNRTQLVQKHTTFQEVMTRLENGEVLYSFLVRSIIAILLLGSINFEADNQDYSVICSESMNVVSLLSRIIGVNTVETENLLTFHELKVGREKIQTRHSVIVARTIRDCLAKLIYDQLFQTIIKSINVSIASINELLDQHKSCACYKIGVLDIFGFESFTKNYFEQICINYANERLHELFQKVVIDSEIELLQTEKILGDNQETYENEIIRAFKSEFDDLTEKWKNFFICLEDEAKVPGGNNTTLAEKVRQIFSSKSSATFCKNANEFSVDHYAGSVTYSLDCCLEKNRELFLESLLAFLEQTSLSALLNHSLTDQNSDYEKTSRNISSLFKDSTAKKFLSQLDKLMSILIKRSIMFVKCIQPFSRPGSQTLDSAKIKLQLKNNGICRAAAISRLQLPIRLARKDFIELLYPIVYNDDSLFTIYKSISYKLNTSNTQDERSDAVDEVKIELQSYANSIVAKLPLNTLHKVTIGNTLVFMSQELYNDLFSLSQTIILNKATKLNFFFTSRILRMKQQNKKQKVVECALSVSFVIIAYCYLNIIFSILVRIYRLNCIISNRLKHKVLLELRESVDEAVKMKVKNAVKTGIELPIDSQIVHDESVELTESPCGFSLEEISILKSVHSRIDSISCYDSSTETRRYDLQHIDENTKLCSTRIDTLDSPSYKASGGVNLLKKQFANKTVHATLYDHDTSGEATKAAENTDDCSEYDFSKYNELDFQTDADQNYNGPSHKEKLNNYGLNILDISKSRLQNSTSTNLNWKQKCFQSMINFTAPSPIKEQYDSNKINNLIRNVNRKKAQNKSLQLSQLLSDNLSTTNTPKHRDIMQRQVNDLTNGKKSEFYQAFGCLTPNARLNSDLTQIDRSSDILFLKESGNNYLDNKLFLDTSTFDHLTPNNNRIPDQMLISLSKRLLTNDPTSPGHNHDSMISNFTNMLLIYNSNETDPKRQIRIISNDISANCTLNGSPICHKKRASGFLDKAYRLLNQSVNYFTDMFRGINKKSDTHIVRLQLVGDPFAFSQHFVDLFSSMCEDEHKINMVEYESNLSPDTNDKDSVEIIRLELYEKTLNEISALPSVIYLPTKNDLDLLIKRQISNLFIIHEESLENLEKAKNLDWILVPKNEYTCSRSLYEYCKNIKDSVKNM